ncbi:MAG: WavE lipopolysaccharide synthesis family protein [Chlorobiales bacterium]
MISSCGISVVVQGPIHHQDDLTKRVLKSVRTHLPDAELILSTWNGSDVSGLDCDVLLLNDDPGAINGNNNVNRQIVSTRNGLEKASRKYAMKLRTDTLLTGTGFLDVFNLYPERRDDFKVFERKIVIPTIYTRHPLHFSFYSGVFHFFHPSDIFQFGLKTDLWSLWNIPLSTTFSRCVPEQYIWTTCLKSTIKDFDYLRLPLLNRLKISQISLCNNFIVETPETLCVQLSTRLLRKMPETCYKPKEFAALHQRYIVNRSNTVSVLAFTYLAIGLMFQLTKGLKLNLGLRSYLLESYKKRLT